MAKAKQLEAEQPDVEDGIQYWTTQSADYNGVLGEHYSIIHPLHRPHRNPVYL